MGDGTVTPMNKFMWVKEHSCGFICGSWLADGLYKTQGADLV